MSLTKVTRRVLADDLRLPGSGALGLPAGTTGERPGAPAAGDLRHNTTLGRAEIYQQAGWRPLAAAVPFAVAVGDETSAITAGAAKVTFRAPFAARLAGVRASLATASSAGAPTIDVNRNGVSIFATPLSIDADERTSRTAATPHAFAAGGDDWADDDEIAIDIDAAGTGAKGLKLCFYLIEAL